MTKENQHLMLEETGIQSALTDEDVKKSLHKVLVEVQRTKMNRVENTVSFPRLNDSH